MEGNHKEGAQSVYRTFNTGSIDWRNAGLAQFAVNALVIANHSTWNEEFQGLMEQVHQLHLMPNDLKCILALYEARGFIHQPGIKEFIRVDDVVNYMNANCHDGQIAIVRAKQRHPFMAIVPGENSKYVPAGDRGNGYHCFGLLCSPRYTISDIWIRWADGQDHSPVKRRKGRTAQKKPISVPADHEAFHYLQKNPTERIGDCVVRAIAAALDISWDEAMDRIASASSNENTTVNTESVYSQLLEKEGFSKRSPMQQNGKRLTGKEFCRALDKVLLKGERVFAYVGRSHVAAVLPFTENGTTHYKIVDSWDSSDKFIGDYWIKELPREEERMSIENVMLAGSYVIHPLFGCGKVQRVHQAGWVAIDFPKSGSRVLDCRWVKHNCKIEGA